MTEFSAFALQFLPFTPFISFCFNLSSSHVNTICKVSSLGRENIGRMGNLRLDLLTLSLEVSLLLHWYYFWTTSQKVFQFRWSILWNNEMRKKVKNKLINVCRTKSHKASAAEAHRGFHTPHQLALCCRYGRQAAQPWQQLPNSKLLRVMQESPTNTGFYRFNSEFLPFCRLTRAICSILKQHWAV